MFVTSDIPSYSLPVLNVKIPEKPISRRILQKESGSIYCELKEALTYILKNHATGFYRNEDKFHWAQRYFIMKLHIDRKLILMAIC